MKKILWIAIPCFLIIVAVAMFYTLNGSASQKNEIAQEVKLYLTDNLSYKPEDIKEIRGIYSFKNKEYTAEVIFSDEPTTNYTYGKLNGKYKLMETTNINGKHMDKTYYN